MGDLERMNKRDGSRNGSLIGLTSLIDINQLSRFDITFYLTTR